MKKNYITPSIKLLAVVADNMLAESGSSAPSTGFSSAEVTSATDMGAKSGAWDDGEE